MWAPKREAGIEPRRRPGQVGPVQRQKQMCGGDRPREGLDEATYVPLSVLADASPER